MHHKLFVQLFQDWLFSKNSEMICLCTVYTLLQKLTHYWFLQCSTLITLVVVIVINMAVGFLPNVDNSAHIGGFIFGFLLGFIFLMRPQYGYLDPKFIPAGYKANKKLKHSCCQYFFFLIALILAILGYITLIFF